VGGVFGAEGGEGGHGAEEEDVVGGAGVVGVDPAAGLELRGGEAELPLIEGGIEVFAVAGRAVGLGASAD
jgi:hypothetical protein